MSETLTKQLLIDACFSPVLYPVYRDDNSVVVIGSFLNLDALCRWLIKENRNVLLLCSGWKNKFNLEDALFAGAVTEELITKSSDYKLGDACLALKYLYQMAKNNPYKFLNHS